MAVFSEASIELSTNRPQRRFQQYLRMAGMSAVTFTNALTGEIGIRVDQKRMEHFLSQVGEGSAFLPHQLSPGFFLLDGERLLTQEVVQVGGRSTTKLSELIAHNVYAEYRVAGYIEPSYATSWISETDFQRSITNSNRDDVFAVFGERMSLDPRSPTLHMGNIVGGVRIITSRSGVDSTPTCTETLPGYSDIINRFIGQKLPGSLANDHILEQLCIQGGEDEKITRTQVANLIRKKPDVIDLLFQGRGRFVGLNYLLTDPRICSILPGIQSLLRTGTILDFSKFHRYENGSPKESRKAFYRGLLTGLPYLKTIVDSQQIDAIIFVTKTSNERGSPLNSIVKLLNRVSGGVGFVLPFAPSAFGTDLRTALPGFTHGANQGPSVFGLLVTPKGMNQLQSIEPLLSP